MPKTISKSVGKSGVNQRADVMTIQELINANINRLIPLRPLDITGAADHLLIGAIEEFQRRIVKMNIPDGRVDPNGKTLAELNKGSGGGMVAPPILTSIKVTFAHGGVTPDFTAGSKGVDGLYESAVTLSGGLSGSFRGSIYPDDMSVKGRVIDGNYDLYLGFHKRGGATPKKTDLVARSDGFRAALIVNNDKSVPVSSDNPDKTTSATIHVHNGYRSKRFSDGCQTIHPDDWSRFVQTFLDKYTELSDWTSTSTYVGKKIGTLEIRS